MWHSDCAEPSSSFPAHQPDHAFAGPREKVMNRRAFLKTAGALAATAASFPFSLAAAELKSPSAKKLPRWRGFNLTEKCIKRRNGNNPPFRESDYQMLADWGFDFTRLPLSYLCWTEPGDWLKIRDTEL